ncbi:MAG: SRPBCC family protein [Gammaproteobacteria bacterium]
MNPLKGLFYTIIGLTLAFLIVGYLLPEKRLIQRNIVISAPVTEVFQQINSAKSFNEWSPWAKLDPNMQFNYSGPESGKGSSMSWYSVNEAVGSGSWMITDVIENEHVGIDLDFAGQGKAASSFDLKSEGTGTEVTWGFVMDAGMNPMHRWFGLMMDSWVGADYEKGLSDLKTLIESNN